MSDGTLKVGTITTSSGSGTITLGQSGETVTVPNGALSGQSYPAFRAYRASSQSISDNASTKVQIDTEDFDTDNCYDNSTNYRFTPTKAGKYFVYAQVNCSSSVSEDIHAAVAVIKKNGSEIVRNNVDPHNGSKANQTYNYFATVVDMNGSSDYLELFGQVDTSSGTPSFGDGTNQTYFGAYRIGA